MRRIVGTSAMGIRMPIIKRGDDLVAIIADVFETFVNNHQIEVEEKDIIGVTESLLARAQGNYVDLDVITEDINEKYDDEISIVFPILSRNRFVNILKAIANSKKKIKIYLSYPADEVGNALMDAKLLREKGINIYTESLSEKDYIDIFEKPHLHPFTQVDYVHLYKSMAVNDNIEIIFSNNLQAIAEASSAVLIANIHDEDYLKTFFKEQGVSKVYSLRDILNTPSKDHGYNDDYGLYGSNMASETSLKLFPRDSLTFVNELQEEIYKKTGVGIEILVYGDGAFKDPSGRIWELADPVVSPAYTAGLEGQPDEIKLKYLADTEFDNLRGDEAEAALKSKITQKSQQMTVEDKLGTTPRNLTDLIGSLCDLVSGSGDKGTPVVYIKGYFDNFSDE